MEFRILHDNKKTIFYTYNSYNSELLYGVKSQKINAFNYNIHYN